MADRKLTDLYVMRNTNSNSNSLGQKKKNFDSWASRAEELKDSATGDLAQGETAGNGALGWLKDSADAGFASAMGGTARLLGEFSPVGNDALNSVADYFDKVAERNSPQAGQELEGLDYVASAVGNALGSGGASALQLAALAGLGSTLGLGGAATAVIGGASKLPAIGKTVQAGQKMWQSPIGKYLVGKVGASPIESASEAGNLISDMRKDNEAGKANYTEQEVRDAAIRSGLGNLGWLTAANMLEAGTLGKITGALGGNLKSKSAKDIARRIALAGTADAISEGGEEYGQNLIGDWAKRANINDLDYDAALEAAKMGAVGGGVLGGFGAGVSAKFSKAKNENANTANNEDDGTIEDTTINDNPENTQSAATGREAFINAIAGQESGGDYSAVNARTGASGKYQIMPENWPAWAEEAGLGADAEMTPENQEIVARYKLGEYYDKYGARGAAIAWYAGEGALGYSEEALNRKQGNGDEPSINEYADSVLGRMGAAGNMQVLNTADDNSDIEELMSDNYADSSIVNSIKPQGLDFSYLQSGDASDYNSLRAYTPLSAEAQAERNKYESNELIKEIAALGSRDNARTTQYAFGEQQQQSPSDALAHGFNNRPADETQNIDAQKAFDNRIKTNKLRKKSKLANGLRPDIDIESTGQTLPSLYQMAQSPRDMANATNWRLQLGNGLTDRSSNSLWDNAQGQQDAQQRAAQEEAKRQELIRAIAEQQAETATGSRQDNLNILAKLLNKRAVEKWDAAESEYDNRRTNNMQALANVLNARAAQQWDAAEQHKTDNETRTQLQALANIVNARAAQQWDAAENAEPFKFVPQRQSMYDGAMRRNLAALDRIQPEEQPSVEPTPVNQQALKDRDFAEYFAKYIAGLREKVANGDVRSNATMIGGEVDNTVNGVKLLPAPGTPSLRIDRTKNAKANLRKPSEQVLDFIKNGFTKKAQELATSRNILKEIYANRSDNPLKECRKQLNGYRQLYHQMLQPVIEHMNKHKAKWLKEYKAEHDGKMPSKQQMYKIAEDVVNGNDQYGVGYKASDDLRAKVNVLSRGIGVLEKLEEKLKENPDYGREKAEQAIAEEAERNTRKTGDTEGNKAEEEHNTESDKDEIKGIELPEGIKINATFGNYNGTTQKKEAYFKFSGGKLNQEFKDKLKSAGFVWRIGVKAWVADDTPAIRKLGYKLTDQVRAREQGAEETSIKEVVSSDKSQHDAEHPEQREERAKEEEINIAAGYIDAPKKQTVGNNKDNMPQKLPPAFEKIASIFDSWCENSKGTAEKMRRYLSEMSKLGTDIEKMLLTKDIIGASQKLEECLDLIKEMRKEYFDFYNRTNRVSDARHIDRAERLFYSMKQDLKGNFNKAADAINAGAKTFSENPDALINNSVVDKMDTGTKQFINDMFENGKSDSGKGTKKTTQKAEQPAQEDTSEEQKPTKRFNKERANKTLANIFGKKDSVREPKPSDVAPKFVNVFDESKAEELIKKIKNKLNRLSANPMFDPELMSDIFQLGGIYVQQGVNKFANWSKLMVGALGEKVRPFLTSAWNSLNKFPKEQELNAEAMQAVMERVGSDFDEGKSLQQIKKDLVEEFGDEVAGYVDAAYEGVKAYPTSDNADSMVQSNQNNTEGGSENGNNTSRTGSISESGQSDEVQGVEDGGQAGRVPGQSDEQHERQVQRSENEPAEKRPSTAGSNGAGSVSAHSGQGEDSAGAAGRGTVPLTPAQKADAKPSETPGHNYTITKDSLGNGNKKTKYKNNVKAIKLLKQLEAEGRQATPTEQEILANYVGWGGLSSVFDINRRGEAWDDNWAKEAKELKELLTDEEYKAARASTTTAFYTPVSVIKNIYSALERLGFKSGKVLEPSMGTGNFFGVMPESMRSKSSLNGVEFDSLTGRIAKQLYQKANIEITGFEYAQFPDGYFDLAISNVPFNNSNKPYDPRYDKYGFNIHNYFFAKAMDKVRPGGLVCFVTSTATMQGGGDSAKLRALLKGKADFVGAIRLPNTTFKDNANTEVTSDVIILQKRKDGAMASDFAQDWLETVPSGVYDKYNRDLDINEYFKNHPEMVLGELKAGGQYGSLIADGEGVNIDKAMQKVIKTLPAGIYEARTSKRNADSTKSAQTFLAPNNSREGTLIEKDGKVYHVEQSQMVELPKAVQEKATSYVGLRDVVEKLLAEQINPAATDEQLSKTRAELNKLYDNFVKKYGPVNDPKNIKQLSIDPDYGILEAIEEYKVDPLTNKATVTKRAIFDRRTVNPKIEINHADNVNDALTLSLTQKNGVDLEFMSKVMDGKDKESIIKELGDRVFENPLTSQFELAEEYLSGNVREKLEHAQFQAKTQPRFNRNVEALKKVQPKDLAPEDISVNLGAPWIPPKDIQAFTGHLLGSSYLTMDVAYVPSIGQWQVNWGRAQTAKGSVAVNQTWGTKHKSMKDLLEAALNQSTPTVTYVDENKKTHVDSKATMVAQSKLREIQEEFKKWIWTDKERADRLTAYYNRNFNNWVLRQYDGGMLNFPGYSTVEPQLKQHQKDVVWRILQDGTCLMAHCVGAGKTWSMQTAAMELKRLGLANKSMFVIPNHMLQQFENEFRRIYPNAKLLTISSDTLPDVNVAGSAKLSKTELNKRRAAKNAKRQSILGKIATEDWDGIIISHNIFKRIPMSPESYNRFYEQQIEEVANGRL